MTPEQRAELAAASTDYAAAMSACTDARVKCVMAKVRWTQRDPLGEASTPYEVSEANTLYFGAKRKLESARNDFLEAIDQCPSLRWRIINEFILKDEVQS